MSVGFLLAHLVKELKGLLIDVSGKVELTAFVGRHTPVRSGGELYNSHLFSAAESEGVSLSYITLSEAPLEDWLGGRLVWRLKRITRTLYMSWKAYRSPSDLFVDVWLAPYLWPWAVFSRRRCLLMVHHLRAHLESSWFRKKWIGWCEGLLINRAERILTVSQSSQHQISEKLKLPVPVDVISPGFERPIVREKVASATVSIQFLFVGHITRAKGVLDLVNALHSIPDDLPWAMHIVGNTDAEPDTTLRLREMITELPSPDRVNIYGRVEDQKLQDLYAMADVFVLPSYWEGYGIVLLEAMARGLPVISTNAGAIPEVVEHLKTGLLVASGDRDELAQAFKSMITDEALRVALGGAAFDAAAQHADWPAMESRCRGWWSQLKSMLIDAEGK